MTQEELENLEIGDTVYSPDQEVYTVIPYPDDRFWGKVIVVAKNLNENNRREWQAHPK